MNMNPTQTDSAASLRLGITCHTREVDMGERIMEWVCGRGCRVSAALLWGGVGGSPV